MLKWERRDSSFSQKNSINKNKREKFHVTIKKTPSNNCYGQDPLMDTKISMQKVKEKKGTCILSNYVSQATY